MARTYKVKATPKQVSALNNILSGEFRSYAEAMREAGYSRKSSFNLRHTLTNRRGVQVYLKDLSDEARKRFKMPLEDKVMDVYLGGLTATTGGTGPQPDWMVRKVYADRFAFLWGWVTKPR